MSAPITVTITPYPLLPPPQLPGDVRLAAANILNVAGTIDPPDAAYVVTAHLVNSLDLANRLTQPLALSGPGDANPGGTFAGQFTVNPAAAGQPGQNISLFLMVVVQDGNDTGGSGFSIRCLPPT